LFRRDVRTPRPLHAALARCVFGVDYLFFYCRRDGVNRVIGTALHVGKGESDQLGCQTGWRKFKQEKNCHVTYSQLNSIELAFKGDCHKSMVNSIANNRLYGIAIST
jgi:hypothetical protein